MKSSAKKVELASVDDLFSTEESRADAQRERVLEIPLSELHPFKNHPFKVKDDEAMLETADSVRQYIVTLSSRLCRILARRWILRYDIHTGILPVEPSRRTRYGIWIIGRENKDDYKNIQRRHLLPFE